MRHDHSKRHLPIAVAVAAAVLGFGWLAGAEKAEEPMQRGGSEAEASKMTLTGTVKAVKEDEGGEHAVQVISPRHGSLLVQDEGKGAELKKYIGKKVTLTASRKHNGEGESILSVEHYRVHGS